MTVCTEDSHGGERVGIVWAVVAILAAVARAAVWVIEQAAENMKALLVQRFERQATEDQDDGDDLDP